MSDATDRGEWLFYGGDPPRAEPVRESAEEALARHLEAHDINPARVRTIERRGGGMRITTDG